MPIGTQAMIWPDVAQWSLVIGGTALVIMLNCRVFCYFSCWCCVILYVPGFPKPIDPSEYSSLHHNQIWHKSITMVHVCHCSSDPCHCLTYGEHLQGLSDKLASRSSNVARCSLDKTYVLVVYGHQGRGNRIEIPSCIFSVIWEVHPDPHGEYMGHKPAATSDS